MSDAFPGFISLISHMTTIAIFSDVHANIDAFEAVLTDATQLGVTDWYCLGGVVGYGSEPGECVRIVREKFRGCVLGNHEDMLNSFSSNRACDEWGPLVGWPLKIARRQLVKEKTWLRALPLVLEMDDIMLVHSSPWRPETFSYVQNVEEAKISIKNLESSVAFIGHTHAPVIWEATGKEIRHTVPGEAPVILYSGSRYLVNVGSVGQPRDGDSRACYVIYDPDRKAVWFRRIPYDIAKAQKRFHEAGLVGWNGSRLAKGQ